MNKKGFTLIELLAMLVILAVLAGVIVLGVTHYLNNSRHESIRVTALNLIESTRRAYILGEKSIIDLPYDLLKDSKKVLDNKLTKSPWNNDYSSVEVSYNDEFCIVIKDSSNKGISGCENDILKNNDNLIYDFDIDPSDLDSNLDISGANAPVLSSNMIPVYYSEDDNKWHKADVNNIESIYKWYDYNDKMWANAVTVSNANGTRSDLVNASVGTVIPIDRINTMWVWIPRYKYTYFNTNVPFSINIVWEKDTDSTGTISCTQDIDASMNCTDSKSGSLVSGTSTYTHPAFTFGDTELKGLWVGKFENSATSIPSKIDNTIHDVIIKPDVYSWHFSSVLTYFKSIRNMEKYNNSYGFEQSSKAVSDVLTSGVITNDNNKVDPHMMKSIEWGAVSYLLHSKYGYNGEIYINNSGDSNCNSYTGRSAGHTSTGAIDSGSTKLGLYTYDGMITSDNTYLIDRTPAYNASSTGTVYGVYDMSGGLWDYVMANQQNQTNGFYQANSGSWGLKPLTKYYDRYKRAESGDVYSRGVLGDASDELAIKGLNGSWYGNYASFPYSPYPWMRRGGMFSYGNSAGVFAFSERNGTGNKYDSSRSSLAIWE